MTEAEIITRRRKWTVKEKAALLAEVAAEGGRVAMVARRHGLSESMLYNWSSVTKVAMPRHAPDPIEFRPIGMIGRTNGAAPVLLSGPECASATADHHQEHVCKIEIELPNGGRMRVNALVSEKALSRISRAVQGAV